MSKVESIQILLKGPGFTKKIPCLQICDNIVKMPDIEHHKKLWSELECFCDEFHTLKNDKYQSQFPAYFKPDDPSTIRQINLIMDNRDGETIAQPLILKSQTAVPPSMESFELLRVAARRGTMFLQNHLKLKEKDYEDKAKVVRKWARTNYPLWKMLDKGDLTLPEGEKLEPFYHYLHLERNFDSPICEPPDDIKEYSDQVAEIANENNNVTQEQEEEIKQMVVIEDEELEVVEVEMEIDEEEYNKMILAQYKDENFEKTEGIKQETQNYDTLECMNKLNQSAGDIKLSDDGEEDGVNNDDPNSPQRSPARDSPLKKQDTNEEEKAVLDNQNTSLAQDEFRQNQNVLDDELIVEEDMQVLNIMGDMHNSANLIEGGQKGLNIDGGDKSVEEQGNVQAELEMSEIKATVDD